MQQIFKFSKIVLDLCGGTGAWSEPYREAGYDVRLITLPDWDVRTYVPPKHVHGILAAPPCTLFANSGARWWKEKGKESLFAAMAIVDACLRIITVAEPTWWCLENPVGRMSRFLGKPAFMFDPCDFGDPYTKRTCLWGKFNIPEKHPVEPALGSLIHLMGPTKDRPAKRSITPAGFARAFFLANP